MRDNAADYRITRVESGYNIKGEMDGLNAVTVVLAFCKPDR